jgi:hypothetical protein
MNKKNRMMNKGICYSCKFFDTKKSECYKTYCEVSEK